MVEVWKENLDNNFVVGAVLTDLSKSFDCIPHDLLIARFSAYYLNSDSLCYIYSYLKDRKQCVQIKQSEFHTIISDVPQGALFGPICDQSGSDNTNIELKIETKKSNRLHQLSF